MTKEFHMRVRIHRLDVVGMWAQSHVNAEFALRRTML